MRRMAAVTAIVGALLVIWGAAGLAQDKPLKKVVFAVTTKDRSEERRVGKECRL